MDDILRAFSIIDRGKDNNGKERDPFWHRIGSAWPNKDAKGFNIELEVAPVPTSDGVVELVIREPSDDSKKPPARNDVDPDKQYRVYSVIDKGKDKDPYWHNLGLAFANKDKRGFNLRLEVMPNPEGGRLRMVIREVTEKEAEAEDTPRRKSGGRDRR